MRSSHLVCLTLIPSLIALVAVGCGSSTGSSTSETDGDASTGADATTTVGTDSGEKSTDAGTAQDTGNDAGSATDSGVKDSSTPDSSTSSNEAGTDGGEAGVTGDYSIGGIITGYAGTGMVLEDNLIDDLLIPANGMTFTFLNKLNTGDPYSVTVKTPPSNPSQTCVITDGSDNVVTANVTNVGVACTTNTYTVGGTVAGLGGATVVLQDNAGDDLSVSAATFQFVTSVASGKPYAVTVKTQPAGEWCYVASPSGTVTNANISVSVTCVQAISCSAIHNVDATAKDGVYTVTPAGESAFPAYCDMTDDNGGWTLALKADGTKQTFAYSVSAWTDGTTLNTTSTDLTLNEAKFASFSTMPFNYVRAVFNTGGTTKSLVLPVMAASLSDLFAGPYVATNLGRTTWYNLVPGSGLQQYCSQEGFNDAPNLGAAGARIGIVGNENGAGDCTSCDSVIGIGLQAPSCGNNAGTGNQACYSPYDVNGNLLNNQVVTSFGYVFVR